MNNLIDLEKKINSELGTKINTSEIKHNQIYLEIDSEDLIDVVLFVKTNKDTKFRQLIDITVVDYPERSQRFDVVYLFLSHEFNQRLILKYSISENCSDTNGKNRFLSSQILLLICNLKLLPTQSSQYFVGIKKLLK